MMLESLVKEQMKSPNPEYAMQYDWGLVRFIKKKTKLPLIIKGILTVDDARNAIKMEQM